MVKGYFVPGDMSSPLKRGYFFRSLCSIGYSEYQPFLVKVKGTANRVVGARGHEHHSPRDKFSTFRSRYSISYSEYQPFLVKLRSKARRIVWLGLRDMCFAALETSSLPLGVKPKRHELPLPRGGNSFDYLKYQPFFVYSKSKARRIE